LERASLCGSLEMIYGVTGSEEFCRILADASDKSKMDITRECFEFQLPKLNVDSSRAS
jgi:hypothetical protein